MSLRRLVLRHLLSHPVRSLLTLGAVVVAIFLFCFLRSVVTTLDAAGQRAEVCGARDAHLAEFGDGPRLLRPPYGVYDATTRTTARACGAKAVVTWTYDLTTWGQWTPPTPELKAGDIILLHFNETLEQDLERALALADAAGLTPAPLREYVPE